MNLKQAKADIRQRLDQGESKTAVFEDVKLRGVSERAAAAMIAAHAAPELCQRHDRIRAAVIVLAWVELLFGVLLGFAVGESIRPSWGIVLAGLMALIGITFVWGFTQNRLWAYNVTIVMTVCNLPRTTLDLLSDPGPTALGLAIGLPLLAFIWYVRTRLFPDIAVLGPRQVDGRYVFTT